MTTNVAADQPTTARLTTTAPWWRMGRRTRHWVLTVHVAVSVGLLGDSAGFLAVAIRHARADDPAVRDATRDVLKMFALFFGIPLSFAALLTGLALGLGTRWGVVRYPWVIAKLALIITVIAVGAIVFRPLLFDTTVTTNDTALIVGAAWDVTALAVATGLSVFKPGHHLRLHRNDTQPAMAATPTVDDMIIWHSMSPVRSCNMSTWPSTPNSQHASANVSTRSTSARLRCSAAGPSWSTICSLSPQRPTARCCFAVHPTSSTGSFNETAHDPLRCGANP